MNEPTRLATVQKRGQVTIPVSLRRKYGISEGSIVAILETEDGILISPRLVLAIDSAHRLQETLRERGLALEEFIKSQE